MHCVPSLCIPPKFSSRNQRKKVFIGQLGLPFIFISSLYSGLLVDTYQIRGSEQSQAAQCMPVEWQSLTEGHLAVVKSEIEVKRNTSEVLIMLRVYNAE